MHSEVRRDDTAEQRPRSRADLLRGEEESKDASFELRGCMLCDDGVQRGLNPGEEEPHAELHDGKGDEGVGDALQDEHASRTQHGEEHRAEVAAPCAVDPPERRGDRARDAAEREYCARDKDDVVHRAREHLDVGRQDGHEDVEHHLCKRAHDHHRAQDGDVPEVHRTAFLRRERCGLLRHRRLFDDKGECEEVDEERQTADIEARAHPEQLCEDAAEQRPHDTARRERALHDAEGEAEFFLRCVERHDGEIHRPES